MRLLSLAGALVLLTFAAQPAPARPQPADDFVLSADEQATYTLAVQSFRQQRLSAAYGRFVKLADAGHVQSARVALMMFRNGPALFGSNWDATPEQVHHWRTLIVTGEVND